MESANCNTETSVVRKSEKGGISIVLGLPIALLITWLACLLYTLANIHYPSTCSFNAGTPNYKSSCYEPLLDPSIHVDIKVFAGLPNESDRISGELVWEIRNHSVEMKAEGKFHVPIPSSVRLNAQFLNCWIVIAPTVDVERNPSLTIEYSLARRIVSSHLLTTLHPILARSKDRDLLRSTDTTTSTSFSSSASSSQESHHDSSIMVQHWKYGHHPLIIRYTHYGSLVLGTHTLASLNYQLKIRFVRYLMKSKDGLSQNDDDDSNDASGLRKKRRPEPFQLSYEPILFFDDLALLRRYEMEISRNTSLPHPKMHLKFEPTSPIHFGFKRAMAAILDILQGFMKISEVEEIKYWMSDERLYRYFLTQIITWVHIALEYLAFRDDWSFFIGRKSFNGISSTSMIFAVGRSTIIFLYLLDADTSMIVLASIAKDVLWSIWKLNRIIKPRIYLYRGFFPAVMYLEHCNLNSEEKESAHHDHIATSHMSLCIYPCVMGLAIYSLLHYQYKSWWTWFVSSLADSVYFFGFISMTPQLYINYKLKSVAHLPLRAFFYKIFSTFIDDVFAFMVKMPLKHRLMTLRDDIIFFGFLYQWWIYRVDKSRPNEYGFQFESPTFPGVKEDAGFELTCVDDSEVNAAATKLQSFIRGANARRFYVKNTPSE